MRGGIPEVRPPKWKDRQQRWNATRRVLEPEAGQRESLEMAAEVSGGVGSGVPAGVPARQSFVAEPTGSGLLWGEVA